MTRIFLVLTLLLTTTQAFAVECEKPIHKDDGLILVNPFQASFGNAGVGYNNEQMFSYVFYKNTNYAYSYNFYTQGLKLNDVRALADEARFKGQMLFMTNNDGPNTNNFGVASEKIVDICK